MKRRITCGVSLVAGIFLLVGLIFGVIALVMYTSSATFMRDAITTNGTIVDCYWQRSTSSSGAISRASASTCKPTVSFQTREGRDMSFTSNFSSSEFREGQEVPVSYHADRPEDARLSSFIALWLLPLIFGGIGGVLLLVALAIIIGAIIAGIRSRTANNPYRHSYRGTSDIPYDGYSDPTQSGL